MAPQRSPPSRWVFGSPPGQHAGGVLESLLKPETSAPGGDRIRCSLRLARQRSRL